MATQSIKRTASAQAAKYNYYLERRAAWLELRGDYRQDGSTLDKAFATFSLALDSVTIPVGYWSEMPREDVGTQEAHRELLSFMQDLEERFRSLAQWVCGDAVGSASLMTAENDICELLNSRSQELAARNPAGMHCFAKALPPDSPAWPVEG
ncbi:hypothetical protein NBRC10512v2_000696 [Rhodotorula toruloides]|uniref:Uncharacterized protein n=1 Tax=Rhodotorula toruloides (strain NP11) TaxID=1130832 RepID=M7WSC2_RHOT1|nr:uncharacterized protein RHTO_07206 [Rhodotorula toruloides NP11]EMS23472.1 hypothetical protein RHTO_07206 [Rhodotorula toruloides NP11]